MSPASLLKNASIIFVGAFIAACGGSGADPVGGTSANSPGPVLSLAAVRQFYASDNVQNLGQSIGKYGSTAYAVATDSQGNVYVAGGTNWFLDNSAPLDITVNSYVAKFDPQGAMLWIKEMDVQAITARPGDYANSVVVDDAGSVFVAGSTCGVLNDPNRLDAYLVRLDASGGTIRYTVKLGGPGWESARGLALDNAGNVYMTGETTGSVDNVTIPAGDPANANAPRDAFLAKFNASDGSLVYVRQFGSPEDDSGRGVAVSGDIVYVTGYTLGAMADNVDANVGGRVFLAQFDVSAGTGTWTHVHPVDNTDYGSWGTAVAADAAGNAFVTGWIGDNLALLKYAPSGTLLFARTYGAAASDGSDNYTEGFGIAVDGFGRVYLTGRTCGGFDGHANAGPANFYDVILVRVDGATGGILSSSQIGTASEDEGFAVALAQDGGIYVVGKTYGDLGGPGSGTSGCDAFLARFSLQ